MKISSFSLSSIVVLFVLGLLLQADTVFSQVPAVVDPPVSPIRTGDPVFDLLLSIIPPGYVGFVLLAIWSGPYLTRGYWAIVNNGGLVNGVKAVFLGLNAPKVLLGCLCLLSLTACQNTPKNQRLGDLVSLAVDAAERRGVLSAADAAEIRQAKTIVLPAVVVELPPVTVPSAGGK